MGDETDARVADDGTPYVAHKGHPVCYINEHVWLWKHTDDAVLCVICHPPVNQEILHADSQF